jgi:hypothetical protein
MMRAAVLSLAANAVRQDPAAHIRFLQHDSPGYPCHVATVEISWYVLTLALLFSLFACRVMMKMMMMMVRQPV